MTERDIDELEDAILRQGYQHYFIGNAAVGPKHFDLGEVHYHDPFVRAMENLLNQRLMSHPTVGHYAQLTEAGVRYAERSGLAPAEEIQRHASERQAILDFLRRWRTEQPGTRPHESHVAEGLQQDKHTVRANLKLLHAAGIIGINQGCPYLIEDADEDDY